MPLATVSLCCLPQDRALLPLATPPQIFGCRRPPKHLFSLPPASCYKREDCLLVATILAADYVLPTPSTCVAWFNCSPLQSFTYTSDSQTHLFPLTVHKGIKKCLLDTQFLVPGIWSKSYYILWKQESDVLSLACSSTTSSYCPWDLSVLYYCAHPSFLLPSCHAKLPHHPVESFRPCTGNINRNHGSYYL